MAAGHFDPASGSTTVLLRELRGQNRLPDQIRDVVFGAASKGQPVRATLTIFERDVRIATNVVTPLGERAIGTRASPEVARRVLVEGLPWNDRAKVLERWTIASYEPIRSAGGEVVGMLYEGVGVAPESTPNLFQKFYRVHDPATTTTKGTGVGLYLVRRFVELHGGRVGVDGVYGSWVTFWFEIP
jgi:hypothetical protein